MFVYRLYIRCISFVYRKYIVRSLFLRPGFAQGILRGYFGIILTTK